MPSSEWPPDAKTLPLQTIPPYLETPTFAAVPNYMPSQVLIGLPPVLCQNRLRRLQVIETRALGVNRYIEPGSCVDVSHDWQGFLEKETP